MGRARAVVLALIASTASAAEKTPAMVWTGAAPSGACKGTRVVAIYDTGALYCCVAGSWASCGTAPGGGSGLPSDPAACPGSQWVIDQNASGVLTCSQPGWTDIASKPATFTPSAHTHPGSDVTSAVANATAATTVPWTGVTSPPATYAPSAHVHAWGDLTSGVPTTFAPSAHTHPQTDLTATGRSTTNFLRGDNTWANEDWATLTGKPTNFQCDYGSTLINIPASFAPTAHTLMGASHSDVDTAAVTGGDMIVRNSGNTQWTHQATGTATQVLHGGTNVVTWGSVDLANDTAATALPVGKGGLGASVTPAAGTIVYGSSGTAHAELSAGSTGQVLRSGGAGAPVWVGVQTCTSSASTTCTITVARSGCLPVCSQTTSVSTTLARAAVSGTTLTCTWPTSGTNTCNCFCP